MQKPSLRLAVDTGGTFTDLVVEHGEALSFFKAPTTAHDPIDGIFEVLALAAEDRGVELGELLADASMFIHGTTRAINAVLTGTTAKTALLTTRGHRDVLLFREGGRSDPFDWTHGYPDAYIPRSLTFDVDERIGSQGEVVRPLDEEDVREITARLAELEVEAVAVCLLWSIVNPAHELRIGELLAEQLPDVPYTLSHELNPVLREYRRASSAAIDASLKPLMAAYLDGLERRLHERGFGGRLLMVTSNGAVLDARDMAGAPIHSINSGPAMAPVAGQVYAELDGKCDTAVVADTGGTSYDVSLVRRGRIPITRDMWLGPEYSGHITSFPAVDVRSIGAGGGSIAWIDDGGLLHVGPQSAGSDPGPVAYRRGGTEPTVTDACIMLGYIDPDYFLGGAMTLDTETARQAIADRVATPLGLEVDEGAAAIMAVATERMIQAIEEITIKQGVDPRAAVLVAGGGAAGLNASAIARRLGCRGVVIPNVGAVLSAAGALMSDLASEFAAAVFTTSDQFDFEAANAKLAELRARGEEFARRTGADAQATEIEAVAEARYAHQVWQIEVPLRDLRFESQSDVDAFVEDFHATHEELYAMRDERSAIEIVTVRARVRVRLGGTTVRTMAGKAADGAQTAPRRPMYFPETGLADAPAWRLESLKPGESVHGPGVIESSFTTIVLEPWAQAELAPTGSLLVGVDSKQELSWPQQESIAV
jgi:N-methylhydantoinase A